MKKILFVMALVVVLVLSIAVVASAEKEGNSRWAVCDANGAYVTEYDGDGVAHHTYIQFWTVAARQAIMGDSTSYLVAPMAPDLCVNNRMPLK